MKAKAVSALRSERGLRLEVNRVAEPQVVGLAPQTTDDRRANTMKIYIRRHRKTVEPQKITAFVAGAIRPAAAPAAPGRRRGRQAR